MRIHLKQNVLQAATQRVEAMFHEFPNIVVNVSGGKDSAVIFDLALKTAQRLNRLPLQVRWLDQEAEWQATRDIIKPMMYHPDVKPLWYQIPFKLFNATSVFDHWLLCWDPAAKEDWVHPQDPISIKENTFGTDRFADLFTQITLKTYPNTATCVLAGVRAEESPSRYFGLTSYATYKHYTWGRKESVKHDHYAMYPIYDWSYTDVWKYIHDNNIPYNRIYDAQYAHGVPVSRMRVSNVHHETAVHSLFYLQELEPRTWERLTKRIEGIHMAGVMGQDDYFITELPFMFSNWQEYRDHLLQNLVPDESWQRRFRNTFARHEDLYQPELGDKLYRMHVKSILVNDWEGVKLKNFEDAFEQTQLRSRKKAAREAAQNAEANT